MTNETLYVKIEQNVLVQKSTVCFCDVGKFVCARKDILSGQADGIVSFSGKEEKTGTDFFCSAVDTDDPGKVSGYYGG